MTDTKHLADVLADGLEELFPESMCARDARDMLRTIRLMEKRLSDIEHSLDRAIEERDALRAELGNK